jgi:hypothetical protein
MEYLYLVTVLVNVLSVFFFVAYHHNHPRASGLIRRHKAL